MGRGGGMVLVFPRIGNLYNKIVAPSAFLYIVYTPPLSRHDTMPLQLGAVELGGKRIMDPSPSIDLLYRWLGPCIIESTNA